MKKVWDGLCLMHDTNGFGQLHELVPGIRYYSDRALVLPAPLAVVSENGVAPDILDGYLDYLRRPDVDLGPGRVLRVKGDGLFAGVLENDAVRREIQEFTMRGGKVQPFCSDEAFESFCDQALIDRRRRDAADLEISRRMNDKAELRRIAADIGIGFAFLPHRVCSKEEEVRSALAALLSRPASEAPFAVMRPTARAGGDGFLRIERGADLDGLLPRYFEKYGRERILVEEGHPHESLSMQLVVRGHSVRVLGWTRQIVGADGRHRGNTLAWREGPGNPHPAIRDEDRVTMETWSVRLAEYARDRIAPYESNIGIDCLRIDRPKVETVRGEEAVRRHFFVSECNARQTATVYLLGVSAQLEGRGLKAWSMVMLNAVPTRARGFGQLMDRMSEIVFSRTLGVLPFNVRLMALSEPQVGLISVGRDFAEAGKMLREAKKRLVA